MSGHQVNRAVWRGRLLFMLSLAVVAVVLGILANYFLSDAELKLAEAQFLSITDRALSAAADTVKRKRLGAETLACVVGAAFPNASIDWPYVTIDGYEKIAENIIATSNGRELAFAPIIQPNEITTFETFALNYFTKDRIPPFPNNSGITAGASSFGFGIWEKDMSLPNTTDQRVHVTDGKRNFESKYEVIAPVIQINSGGHTALMLDAKFDVARSNNIDNLIDCALRRQGIAEASTNASEYLSLSCVSVSDFLRLVTSDSPASVIVQPIYPYHSDTIMTGIIASSIAWDETLQNIFTKDVSGIDCVLTSYTESYTFRIKNGVPSSPGGIGDAHNRQYEKFRQSISLTGNGLFNDASPEYILTIYPNAEFFDAYSTNNPRIAAIGAVCIIALTSILFTLYDYFVRLEFDAKKDMLNAKRQFMRFVSHEVRTPLNSVIMGLTLLREEMEKVKDVRLHKITLENGNEDCERGLINNETNDGMTKSNGQMNGAASSEIISLDTNKICGWLDLTSEIHSNSLSAVSVLNDLLNYDKIEMGTMQLEYTIIDVCKLLKRTADEFIVSMSQKKIKYEVDFSALEDRFSNHKNAISNTGEAIKVVGDSVRLAQCIRNLLSNSQKFTNEEEGRVTFVGRWAPLDKKFITNPGMSEFALANGNELSCRLNGYIELLVSDNGVGMSQDQLLKLFRDGVQFNVNELQDGNGTGLGLHITKGIVEQHKGTLNATSDGLKKGATFTLTLPTYSIPYKHEEISKDFNTKTTDTDIVDESTTIPLKRPLRILIVEDAAMNRKLLRRLLENHGHKCYEALDGQQGLTLVEESMQNNELFDTILMDNEMPVMNGPTAAKRIRDLGCSTCILGITGNVLPDDITHFKQSGANDVLPKPFKLEELERLWDKHNVF